ncbi:MAG: acyl-CoA synthetase [Chloroflexi bacterium]|nr:acyl-CoA synthetase [Chloroflexota bacterium]
MDYPSQLQAELLPKGAIPEIKVTLPEAQVPEELNLTEWFLDRNLKEGRGERIAFYCGDRQITYQALYEMVNRLANGLRGLGIGRGDRVMLRIPNSIEFVVSALALHRLGAVVIPTLNLLREKTITHVANIAEAKAIVVSHDLREEIELGRDKYKTMERLIAVGGNQTELSGRGYDSFEELIERSSDRLESARMRWGDLAAMFFTSGTTGMPKGCMQLHVTMAACAFSTRRVFGGIQPSDVIGGAPPLAFVFGYGHLMFISLLHGVPCAFIEGRVTPEKMFELIQRHRVTVFNSAPAGYNQMLNVPEEVVKSYDISSIRVWLSGGAPLLAATVHQWQGRFGELRNTMGSTETFQSYLATWKPGGKPGSVGHPMPGWEARILDEQGNDCPRGTIGRLAIRGPGGLMYWRNPEQQKLAVTDGWSLVGDLAYEDEDGCFWHVSRSDDMIKSRGYRVSPGEVEDVLMEHPAVFDPAVIGVPDAMQGERVKAFVVPKAGYQASPELAEELRQWVRSRLAAYQAPRDVEFVDALPKTETGKIRRVELRQLEARRAAEGQSDADRKDGQT